MPPSVPSLLMLLLLAAARRSSPVAAAAFFSSIPSCSLRSSGAVAARETLSSFPSSTAVRARAHEKPQSALAVSRSVSTTTTAMNPDSANGASKPSYPTEMTEDERYLFDLNGYLVVRGVFTPEEVQAANDAIDKRASQMVERSAPALRNAVEGTALYGTGPGRKDLGGVLEWGLEDSKVFKSVLAHPRLLPLFHGLIGKGYRMDHLPFVIAQDRGAEGFQLHGGTIDCVSGEYNPNLAYTYNHGKLHSSLLAVSVVLTDHNEGDGGFCVVPGSHKSNFKMPKGMVDGENYQEFIRQPVTKAGDVVIFSEGTVHGAMAWNSDRQRRVCLYRFAPASNAYGRSYFGNGGSASDGGWPEKMYEGLTEAEKAVLEPPYANRLDRPNINEDGKTVTITTRNERKKKHDRDVFGTKYF